MNRDDMRPAAERVREIWLLALQMPGAIDGFLNEAEQLAGTDPNDPYIRDYLDALETIHRKVHGPIRRRG